MTTKRIFASIVGVLAAVAGVYLGVLSVVVFEGYGVPEAPNFETGVLAVIVVCLAAACLYEAYRLLRFVSKKWQ